MPASIAQAAAARLDAVSQFTQQIPAPSKQARQFSAAPQPTASDHPSPRPTTNALGQQIGTIINTTA